MVFIIELTCFIKTDLVFILKTSSKKQPSDLFAHGKYTQEKRREEGEFVGGTSYHLNYTLMVHVNCICCHLNRRPRHSVSFQVWFQTEWRRRRGERYPFNFRSPLSPFAGVLVPLFGLHNILAAFKPDAEESKIRIAIEVYSALSISFQVRWTVVCQLA